MTACSCERTSNTNGRLAIPALAGLLVLYQTSWQYSHGDPPPLTNRWLSIDNCEQQMRRRPCSTTSPHRRRRISESLIIYTVCSMHDHGEEKRTQQDLFIRSGKSEAQVTNRRRLRSTNCTIKATDRHEASRGLSATAGLLIQ